MTTAQFSSSTAGVSIQLSNKRRVQADVLWFLVICLIVALGNIVSSFYQEHGRPPPSEWSDMPYYPRNGPINNKNKSHKSKSRKRGALVSACTGPLHGGIDRMNIAAIVAWLKYHRTRWRVTHVDMYISAEDDEHVITHLIENRIQQFQTNEDYELSYSFHTMQRLGSKVESQSQRQKTTLRECLRHSILRDSDYLIYLDFDEFLVSKQYQSLGDMFEGTNSSSVSTNSRAAISFPTFINNYQFCSHHKPTFGSTTYRTIAPVESDLASLTSTTTDNGNLNADDKFMSDAADDDPLSRSTGSVLKVIRPKLFQNLLDSRSKESSSSPTTLSMLNLAGIRVSDGQDAKVVRYEAYGQQQFSTNLRFHHDVNEFVCGHVPEKKVADCPDLSRHGVCTWDDVVLGSGSPYFIHEPNEVNTILENDPLNDPAMEVYEQSLCYRERYDGKLRKFCKVDHGVENDKTNCRYDRLVDHFRTVGNKFGLIFGCSRSTQLLISRSTSTLDTFDDSSQPGIHLLFFETDDTDPRNILPVRQCLDLGIPASVVGRGVPFNGFGTKWPLIQKALQKLPRNQLTIISDARDVILNIHRRLSSNEGAVSVRQHLIAQVKGAFQTMTKGKDQAVVMGAEAQCCVTALLNAKLGDFFESNLMGEVKRASRACDSGNKDGCDWVGDRARLPWERFQHTLARNLTGVEVADAYLNSGVVIGTAENLLRIMKTADIAMYEDDQAVFTDLMYHRPDLIVLDYAQELVGNGRHYLGMERGGCLFESSATEDGRLQHKETKAAPLLLHTPGKFFPCLEQMSKELGES